MRHFFENWEISNNELNVLKLEFEYFFLCVYMYLCMPPIISIIVLNCLPLVGPLLAIKKNSWIMDNKTSHNSSSI
jgi:hypothetical protein